MSTQIATKSIPRVSYNRELLSFQRQPRSLSIQVQEPILVQYNYIDLRKSKKNRIDHLIMKDLPLLSKSKSHDSTQRDKWEKSLDRYILAKQKMQARKNTMSSEFEFLKLNKINRYRKKKLVQANYLPITIINTTDLHENYSFDLTETLYELKHSAKIKERTKRRLSTEKDTSHASTTKNKGEISPKAPSKNGDRSQQQQRIMNNLLQNYFKKKYSHQLSKLSPKLKINKYSSALLRKKKIIHPSC